MSTNEPEPVDPSRTPADVGDASGEDRAPSGAPVAVRHNRSELTMAPLRGSAQRATFYLGKVLLAEAHVRAAGVGGHAAPQGRDLEQALARALVHAAHRAGVAGSAILSFAQAQAAALEAVDAELTREVGKS